MKCHEMQFISPKFPTSFCSHAGLEITTYESYKKTNADILTHLQARTHQKESTYSVTHCVSILTRGSKSISLRSKRCILESNAASTT